MTLEELKAVPLKYTFGYSADTHAVRQYINEEHGICKHVHTKRNPKTGEWGMGKAAFMLIKTLEEFDSLEGLLEAINRKETA